MSTPSILTRPGHPDFLDLPWDRPMVEWDHPRLVEIPTGVHRHEVCFVVYGESIYVIKELPTHLARHEFEVLRALQGRVAAVAEPVGVVERPWVPPDEEHAAAVITRFARFAFPYRRLIQQGGFGRHRRRLLDAFAGLLVELHLAGCFWGDCSLSNVLYRFDADDIDAIMIDAETAELHEVLSTGQRLHDIDIMIENVAGGMADIAAAQGLDLDAADLDLGIDIARRYHLLWNELNAAVVIGPNERYRIQERIERLRDLGFVVEDVELVPVEGGDRLRLHLRVGGRSYHRNRLRELTGVDASEQQARMILADLRFFEAQLGADVTSTQKSLAAIKWRVGVFEPMLQQIAALIEPDRDPIQAYCDFLHHRYLMATEQGRDISNDEAFASWVAAGLPGFDPVDPSAVDAEERPSDGQAG